MTKLDDLAALGQSIWLDFIRRKLLTTGELQALIELGVRGMTSNPTIFEKAIAGSPDYEDDLNHLAIEGQSAQQIYDALSIADIQKATDLFRPVYERTSRADGYVSLEVSPLLAKNTQQTIDEARRLWSLVDRPNLMVKIPATQEGLPAITQATADGINVNITLIFSLKRYDEVMQAYLLGLQKRLEAGLPLNYIHSVASFFVSRLDSKVDKRLEAIRAADVPGAEQATNLLGKAAVANARLAYQQFCQVFQGPPFQELSAKGANLQRPLWASTSTKNPAYPDLLYVQNLIGEHTVNTLPQETLRDFLDHGEVRSNIEDEVTQAQAVIDGLEELGISMDQVTQELEDEGVASFAKSFHSLMATIENNRTHSLAHQPGGYYNLNNYQFFVDSALNRMEADQVLPRIWKHDHTVWKPDPKEITNRLGWLTVMDEMQTHLGHLEALAYAVQQAGYTHALLLGMGGSSLAPELFSRVFGATAGALQVEVLDSTDPASVLAYAERLDPATTLYIVSTKSGSTEETLSFFKYFYTQTLQKLGAAQAGEHFAAITDPGSKLIAIAQEYSFRATLINDADIGGRYSALSYFGLLPAALCGVDLHRLLDSAVKMARLCSASVPARQNPAARLGAALGELSKKGRDKATFILSPAIAAFGDWVEQLIAESTGKEGKGILPVVGEPLGDPGVYGPDRLFIDIRLEGDSSDADSLAALEAAGHPIIRVGLSDIYDLGGQFFLWELATAVAGQRLGINPFDQPDVESAKVAARAMAVAYKETGKLPEQTPLLSVDGVSVYLPVTMESTLRSPGEALQLLLDQAHPGDYICLQAFIPPTQQNAAALQALRQSLRNQTHLATTLGFGPRFLHSTGQLHKGDRGRGLFVQFTYTPSSDADIPLEAGKPQSVMSFGVLQLSQALGDRQALVENDRRVIRFHLEGDIPGAISSLWK